MLKRSLVVFLV